LRCLIAKLESVWIKVAVVCVSVIMFTIGKFFVFPPC
jgi:hypothetical protein